MPPFWRRVSLKAMILLLVDMNYMFWMFFELVEGSSRVFELFDPVDSYLQTVSQLFRFALITENTGRKNDDLIILTRHSTLVDLIPFHSSIWPFERNALRSPKVTDGLAASISVLHYNLPRC